jgi:hypothetical protein
MPWLLHSNQVPTQDGQGVELMCFETEASRKAITIWYALMGISKVLTLGALSYGYAFFTRKLTIEDTGLPGSTPTYGNGGTIQLKQVREVHLRLREGR